MAELRVRFHKDMHALEERALAGLSMVVTQLDRAIESVAHQEVRLAGLVVNDDVQIDRCYFDVHKGVLLLIVLQAPVADDLRLLVGLLHVIRCIERMGDQCVNIAKLVPLSGTETPNDDTILDLLVEMSASVRRQINDAHKALRTRDITLARDLVRQDDMADQLNRQIFSRAVDIGDDHELREWAMFMTLVARCLERIGDNTVDIAAQTVFIVTGLFREPSNLPG